MKLNGTDSGWWLSLPRWKMMEFVSWDDDIPNIWRNKKNIPNHQPVYIQYMLPHIHMQCMYVCMYIHVWTCTTYVSVAFMIDIDLLLLFSAASSHGSCEFQETHIPLLANFILRDVSYLVCSRFNVLACGKCHAKIPGWCVSVLVKMKIHTMWGPQDI